MRAWSLLAALFAFVLDQTTKAWALAALWPPYSDGIELLPVLNLKLGFNTGITFGIFSESAASVVWLLVGAKALVVALLLTWLARAATRLEAIALSLIIGGAVGNIADRIRLGAVVDFIDAHHQGRHWPTFNLADVAIVCGVGLVLFGSLRKGVSQADAR